nr:MAG TPA: hypothetical protein [Caudoviricetes sp.]
MKTQWAGRAIILADESTARVVLEDRLHDIDVEHLCAPVLTDEARQYAAGLFGLSVEFDSEWSAERSAEAVYEYMQNRGELVTKGRTSVSLGKASPALGDDRGESGDEADIEIAAEYLYAAAHEN